MLNKTEYYFLEIVRSGNLNQAAATLFVSQPSLTKYIQRLEKQLGTALFDRSSSPMRLNDAGKIYYQYLLTKEANEQQLLASISQINQMERGTLRLGMPSYCAQCFLPGVLQRFNQQYPGITVELYENSGDYLEQALQEQRIDLAILHLPVTHPELVYQPLFQDRVLLAVPKSSDHEQDEILTVYRGSIHSFSDQPFILPLTHQKLGRFVANIFATLSLNPQIYMRVQNIMTKLSLTALGMGVTFVPESGLDTVSQHILGKLDFYELEECTARMQLVALTRKDTVLPAYSRHFVELLAQSK